MQKRNAAGIGSEITAVLGPTNTGKTHRCIERLLTHDSGMLGLPLRLLAREVYDKLVAQVGAGHVALVTGEEKHVPRGARFWICTVEAMPMEREVDFLAVDEIQLVGHATRGHVFTQRLLRARGRKETWFLGSDACRDLIQKLVPTARFETYRRFSQLRYAGQSTLAQLPERSAVVGFTIAQVYALAERIRGKKGGAAVILGALSPKTRNAQVAMFQAGEVGYLVATDAIGMGLNMNVQHIAFASLRKFDGHKRRSLSVSELAQIAGRAGRHIQDGTFGTLRPCQPLAEEAARSIETHRIEPLRAAFYRNDNLDFSSLTALQESLGQAPPHAALRQMHEVDDQSALHKLAARPEVRHAVGRDGVALLWQVCQIPDYRKLLPEAHAGLLGEIFLELRRSGQALSNDWMRSQTDALGDVTGDLETLTLRLSFVRTFAYLSQHEQWLKDAALWQQKMRELENAISDEVHERLLQRFVAKERARVPPQHAKAPRRRTPGSHLDEPPRRDGPFAQLAKLRLALSAPATTSVSATASWEAAIVSAAAEHFEVKTDGQVCLEDRGIGRLLKGTSLRRPRIAAEHEHWGQTVKRRLTHLATELPAELELALPECAKRSGAARGIVYQLNENLGTIPAASVRALCSALDPSQRAELLALGVCFGAHFVWVKGLLEPRPLALRFALCSVVDPKLKAFAPSIHRSWFRVKSAPPKPLAAQFGFARLGGLLVRCDIAERALGLFDSGATAETVASAIGCDVAALTSLQRNGQRRVRADAASRSSGARGSRRRSDSA